MFLDEEIERICHSGVLGRSQVYRKLLNYLKETTVTGTAPKEIDIAVDVFDRTDFHSATDSTVRVYLHNLRQKLNGYYQELAVEQAQFIFIPKGAYRLEVGNREESLDTGHATDGTSLRLYGGLAAGILAIFFLGWHASGWFAEGDDYDFAAATPIWQPLLQSDRPLVVVLGDYYMFAEVDADGITRRLIRDFRVDGGDDLEAVYDNSGDSGKSFADIRLGYLPVGVGVALADVMSVIRSTDRTVVVMSESDLDIQTVRSSDIVYLGYLSGLGILSEFVFASSNVVLGRTYDELVNRQSGEVYVSEAGFLDGPTIDYLDYGFISTFSGPTGNQLLIIAGMRDEGLMQMATVLSSREAIDNLIAQLPAPAGNNAYAAEALYRVRGMNRMNVASSLVLASALKKQNIWIDTPQDAG
ncbi:MAG: hypothetical protein WD795_06590 [Woeseia sp.]